VSVFISRPLTFRRSLRSARGEVGYKRPLGVALGENGGGAALAPPAKRLEDPGMPLYELSLEVSDEDWGLAWGVMAVAVMVTLAGGGR
jgi:hypothetical protein